MKTLLLALLPLTLACGQAAEPPAPPAAAPAPTATAPTATAPTAKAPTAETPAEGQLYTCPMHPDVMQHAPGSCPTCGMNLVPAEGHDQGDAPAEEAKPAEDHADHEGH